MHGIMLLIFYSFAAISRRRCPSEGRRSACGGIKRQIFKSAYSNFSAILRFVCGKPQALCLYSAASGGGLCSGAETVGCPASAGRDSAAASFRPAVLFSAGHSLRLH